MPRDVNETIDFKTGKVVQREVIPWDAESLKARIAAIRYERETGGITVGDQPVTTLRDERADWLKRELSIATSPLPSYEYKPRNGDNVTLTPEQVIRCSSCFAWYVEACFATERALRAAIDGGGDLDEIAASLETCWPPNTFNWE